jgi:hypothetical protein
VGAQGAGIDPVRREKRAMARITIADGVLTVHMRGLDKILALHGNISVPLSQIQGVDVRPEQAFVTESQSHRTTQKTQIGQDSWESQGELWSGR